MGGGGAIPPPLATLQESGADPEILKGWVGEGAGWGVAVKLSSKGGSSGIAFKKGGGGGPTTYSGQFVTIRIKKLSQKEGSGPPAPHPPGSAPGNCLLCNCHQNFH